MTISLEESHTYQPETSVWEDEKQSQKEQRDNLNDLLESTSKGGISPIRSTLNTSWDDISTNQQKYYSRKAAEAIKATLTAIAPGQENTIWDTLKGQQLLIIKGKENPGPLSFDPVMVNSFVKAYELAETWQTRQQILSIFAYDFSKADLQQLIPGLSKWRIDKARHHATSTGKGKPVSEQTIFRSRVDPGQIEHFVDFLSQPTMIQDVAFGTKTLKLDSGDQVIIPAVIRTLIPSRIIEQYKLYCEEQGLEPMSQRTLYRIIEVCSASMQKSLQGLDNFSADGGEGFDNLLLLLDTLQENGVDKSWVSDKKQALKDSKRYLKTDYKAHLGKHEHCQDHCTSYALSDSSAVEFRNQCDHVHHEHCDRCESLADALKKIELKCDGIEMTAEQQERIKYEFKQCFESITLWKCHLLRTVNQEEAKQDILKELGERSCLIVMDWAMKFLPQRFRERMSDFFGKRGKSWHVSAIIMKSKESKHEVECLVHIFNSCKQDSFAIVSILENTLETLKEETQIKEVYLRSDNAGCYHSGQLVLSLPGMSKRTGIAIKRYDFSDPQAGKDICDRKIATMKAHIRRFINEKHDVVTAQDMKNALESHGGVKGCRVAVAEVDTSLETGKDNKIPGISFLNDFAFEETGIRTWKAYGVGKGRLLRYNDLAIREQGPTGITLVEPFGPRGGEVGHISVSKKDSEEGIFHCNESSCVLTFHTFKLAQEHMDTGEHVRKVERESLHDIARKRWAENVSSIGQVENRFGRSAEVNNTTNSVSANGAGRQGWALKATKKNTRISDDVRSFLVEQFNAGERSGKKVDPADVARELKFAKNENGDSMFQSADWYTAKQIKSFFSRHAAKQRKMKSPPTSGEEDFSEDMEDIEACEAEEQHFSLCSAVHQALDGHPITAAGINFCEAFTQGRLTKFKLKELSKACEDLQLVVSCNPRRKQSYITRLEEHIKVCTCQDT